MKWAVARGSPEYLQGTAQHEVGSKPGAALSLAVWNTMEFLASWLVPGFCGHVNEWHLTTVLEWAACKRGPGDPLPASLLPSSLLPWPQFWAWPKGIQGTGLEKGQTGSSLARRLCQAWSRQNEMCAGFCLFLKADTNVRENSRCRRSLAQLPREGEREGRWEPGLLITTQPKGVLQNSWGVLWLDLAIRGALCVQER